MKCTRCQKDMLQIRSKYGNLYLRCPGFETGCRMVAFLNQESLEVTRGPFNSDDEKRRIWIRRFATRIVRAHAASALALRDMLAAIAQIPPDDFHLDKLGGEVLVRLHAAIRDESRRLGVNRLLRGAAIPL